MSSKAIVGQPVQFFDPQGMGTKMGPLAGIIVSVLDGTWVAVAGWDLKGEPWYRQRVAFGAFVGGCAYCIALPLGGTAAAVPAPG